MAVLNLFGNIGGQNLTNLPKQVTEFVVASDATPKITLSWKNPADFFGGIMIRRKAGSAPQNTKDGIKVYEGTSNTYIDTSIEHGIEYFYRAFPYNPEGQYQTEYAVISSTAINLPSVSLTPKQGVSYAEGIGNINVEILSLISNAISNTSAIANSTGTLYADYGDIHREIKIGNQVNINVNGTAYAFDIIGFNHDDLTSPTAYGATTATGKAGITLQMHDIFGGYRINYSPTNKGGWKASHMNKTRMPQMKEYLPAEWQKAIKSVYKPSLTGDRLEQIELVENDCFLLSQAELFPKINNGEGIRYPYFYMYWNVLIKYKNATPDDWWTRTPYYDSESSDRWIWVGETGSGQIVPAENGAGISFAFCI